MTPEERAEKILTIVRDFADPYNSEWCVDEIASEIQAYHEEMIAKCLHDGWYWTQDKVQEAIRAAVEEAVGDERSSHAYDVMVPLDKYDKLETAFKAEAYEDAAKIMEDYPDVTGFDSTTCVANEDLHHEWCYDCQREERKRLAKQIRARAKEIK